MHIGVCKVNGLGMNKVVGAHDRHYKCREAAIRPGSGSFRLRFFMFVAAEFEVFGSLETMFPVDGRLYCGIRKNEAIYFVTW